MEPQQLILLAFQVSIVLTVFGFGLQATSDDLLYLVRRPGLLTRSLVAMFLVMPVIAVTLAVMFNLRRAVEIDVVALAISAVPPLLPNKGSKAGGHSSYALALMVIVAVLSIVIVPVAVTLIGWLVGQSLELAPAVVARVVLTAIVVPVVAGMAVRAFSPAIADYLEKPLRVVSHVLLPAAVVALLVATASTIWALADSGTLLAMTLFVVAGLATGHVLGGPEPDHSVVLALSTACRHPGIAIGIVTANFPDVRPGGTILLYLLVAAVICIPYIAWSRRHAAAAVPA